jgi:hypothetical protein
MPSVSKSQQRLMGMAYAVKSGDMELSDIDPAYRDKVKSLSDGMTKKDLKKYAATKHDGLPETVDEAFIGPFVFNDSMSDEELLGMYNGALDGYANYAKGMHYAKSDYKKAYQEIEKILKKRGVSVDESAQGAVSLNPGMTIGGIGDPMLPTATEFGSGDVPAVADIDDDEEEAKKDNTKTKLEMENLHLTFDSFLNEASNFNDPVLVAFRAARMKREEELAKPKRKPLYGKQRQKAEDDLWNISQDLKDLYADRGQMLIDMEQEAEAEGGPIADEYGGKLNDIEDQIQALIVKRNKLEMKLAESVVTEGVKLNGQSDGGKAKLAEKEFGHLLPVDFKFANVTTPGGRKRLAIKYKGKPAFEFSTGLDKGIAKTKQLDKAWVESGINYIKKYVAESVVNEKKLDREDMMAWIEQHMDFVRTTEEFNGSPGGIWVSGENGDEYKGRVIYAYYSEDYKNRTFGVDNRWEKELNKRGWYSEWHDAGTSMIWPL